MTKQTVSLIMALVLVFTFITPAIASTDPYLIVNEPIDKVMISSRKVVVSGETLPNSTVGVLLNGTPLAELPIGAAGIFIYQVPVTDSDNIITVRASFSSGDSQTVSRRVYKLDSEERFPELDSLIKTFTKSFLILR